ncbi:MAG: restriction endonuclease subunit S [Afipia sp.]|nr:restriction endonuclease subunit S [Afipia sp.]
MRAPTELKRLEDVCELFADGDWIETKDQSPSGIRLIQTGNVGNGEFKDRAEKARFVSEDTFKRLRCTEIFEGDCLVSRLPDPVGRSCLLPATNERMITAVDCTIIRFKRDVVDPKYFYFFSQSNEYFKQIEKLTTGATRQRISRSNLGTVVVPRPSLPEQQRIVAILDEAFAGLATATANAEKNLKNARELFESALNSTFGTVGKSWPSKKLGQVAEVQSGGTPSRAQKAYWNGKLPWYSSGELNDLVTTDAIEKISSLGLENSNAKLFPKRSLLIGMYDTAAMKMSITDREASFNQAIAGVKPNSALDLVFVLHALLVVKAAVLDLRRGVRQKNLSLEKIKNIEIKLPTIEIQKHIVERLLSYRSAMVELEQAYRRKLEGVAELRQSILQKAFSGELTSPPSQAIEEAAE